MELFVFYANERLTKSCLEAGIDGIVVDLENSEKRYRQSLYNTQINKHDFNTLKEARLLFKGDLICRVNGGDKISGDEIQKAIDYGANYIMLPMIKVASEVERVLKIINGRAKCIPMIELHEAVINRSSIGALPVEKIYVGLNDLAISRNSRNIFTPMIDGTMDEIRASTSINLGVAGLTHPQLGQPIPSGFLLNEMKRLNCGFTFLRRSFFKDSKTHPVAEILSDIRYDYAEKKYSYIQTQEFKQMVKCIKTPLI